MPDEYTDQPIWNDEKLDVPADGDDANGLTFYDERKQADRTRFLLRSSALALSNVDIVHTFSGEAKQGYRDVCYAPGAFEDQGGGMLAVGYSNIGQFSSEQSGLTSVSLAGSNTWANNKHADATTGAPRYFGVCHGGPGAFGSRLFMLCGDRQNGVGTGYGAIWSSIDTSFPLTPVPRFNFSDTARWGTWLSIKWNGSVFCAGGGPFDDGYPQLTTCDGVSLGTWTPRTPGSGFTGTIHRILALPSGRIVATGDDGEIQTSDDNGVTWTRRHSDAEAGNLQCIVRTRSGALLAGGDNSSSGTKKKQILRSTDDGATWQYVDLFTVASALAPEQFDLGSRHTLVQLGAVTGCVMRDTAISGKLLMALSFDDGITWPAVARFPSGVNSTMRNAAEDGSRAVIVGESIDNSFGLIHASLRQIMAVSEMV